MKTTIKCLLFAVCLSTMTSCYRVQPNADQESVLVMKPYFLGHGGVDENVVSAGSEWCAVTTDHYEFSITPITITEEFEKLIPSDNTPLSFSVYLKLQIRKGQTPLLYKNFGLEWYINSLQSPFRTMVRDKASAFKMLELSSKREVSSSLEKDILKEFSEYVKSMNVPVEVMLVSIGTISPPDEVLTETKLTAAQNQSILTQNSRKLAEDARRAAEISKAKADKAYMEEMNMTIEQYTEMRRLEIQKETVELIKDKKDVSMIVGSGIQPMYNAKR